MLKIRRQLSLFVPEPERSPIDAVRRKFDPKQYSVIPVHVTLCRDEELDLWIPLVKKLSCIENIEIVFELGMPQRMVNNGVMIPMANSSAAFDDLRCKLLGNNCVRHTPHITLLHPRNASGKESAYKKIRAEILPVSVTFTEISLIEQINGGIWKVISTSLPILK